MSQQQQAQESYPPPTGPTETTPLTSPPPGSIVENYHSTQDLSTPKVQPLYFDSENQHQHHPSSLSDSGSGYASGSGRRESISEARVRRKSSRSSGRRISNSRKGLDSGESTPRATHILIDGSAGQEQRHGSNLAPWILSSSHSGNDDELSPAEGISPRIGATLLPESAPRESSSRRRASRDKPSPATGPDTHGKGSTRSQSQQNINQGNSTGPSQHENQQEEEEGEDSWGWFKHLIDKYGAVELDNKGSVARDHLALERTFLAWLRTSLAFASIGIAITQLFRLNSSLSPHKPSSSSPMMPSPAPDPLEAHFLRLRSVGKPLGATFLGVSIVILVIGFRRYFESQYWIIRGKFPASRGSVFLVTAVAAALIVVSLVVVVIVGRVG